MLLSTLCATLLGNLLTSKGAIKTGERETETIWRGQEKTKVV